MEKQSVLLVQKEYIEMINDLKNIKISLPNKEFSGYGSDYQINNGNSKLTILETKMNSHKVNPHNDYMNKRKIFAYDESIAKYNCLQGTGYHTAHSLIHLSDLDYVALGLLSFYFYTSSKSISDKASFIKHCKDIEMESKRDYINDRIKFLLENVPPNSLLMIDGPLIAGDVYTYMIRAIESFLEKNIIPVFFVKNSSSNLVTNNIFEISDNYNSDLHWSYEFLKEGERSSFIKYVDSINNDNSKVFCYFKAFNKSPQRIEFHLPAFLKFEDEIEEIVSLIYYMILAQGEKNPQTRPIAIAEKYAREYLKLSNIDEYFFNYGFIPTMNQERFG